MTPETMATATNSRTTKTLETLAAPSPPLLQLVTQLLIAAAGVPAQMAVAADFPTPPSLPLQPVETAPVAAARAPVAATVRAPAQALMAAAGIPPQGFVLMWENCQPPPPFVAHFDRT